MKRKTSDFLNFRPIPLFAVGMCIGVFFGDISPVLFLCTAAAILIAAALFRSKYVCVVCMGIFCAIVRLLFVPSPIALTDNCYVVRGTVYSTSADKVVISDISLNGRDVSGRMLIRQSTGFDVGDCIQAYTSVCSTDSMFNRRTLRSNGILYCADSPEGIKKVNEVKNVHVFFGSLRKNWSVRIEQIFGKNAGIVKGMMLGDASDIEYADLTLLRSAGVAHILALSGLHVNIVAGFLTLIGVNTFGRRFATFCTPAVLAVYVAIVGFPVSFVRALIAVTLRSLAVIGFRRYDSFVSIGIGAILILFVNPYTLFSASFILSFGAAFSIIMLSEPIDSFFRDYQRRKHIKNYFRESLSLDIAASAGSIPLSAAVFGNIAVFSAVTNLFCIPIASAALVFAFFCCFFDLLSLNLVQPAAFIVSILLEMIRDISDIFTSLPFSVVNVGKLPAIFAILVFLAFFVLSDYFFMSKRKKGFTALSLFACALIACYI